LVVAFGYSISRLIVRHDVNAFRLLFLWGRTKLGNRNRAFWGGSSYSPLPLAGLRRKGFERLALIEGAADQAFPTDRRQSGIGVAMHGV
jgi:type IV secretion system protein VirB3